MATTFNRLYIEINRDVQDIITAVEGDTKSRYLDVTLFSNSQNIDISGNTIRIYMKKPDGTEIFNEGQILDYSSGRVQFELTSQALAVSGVLETQIIIFSEDETEILSTNRFKIFVTESLISDNSIESSNEYGALVILFQDIYDARRQITEINEKIGVAGEKGEEISKSTVFEELEYLIDFSEKNSVGSLGEKIDNISANVLNIKSDVPINWPALPNLQVKRLVKSDLSVEKVISSVVGTGSLVLAVFQPKYETGANNASGSFKVEIDENVIFNCDFNITFSSSAKSPGRVLNLGIINDTYYTGYFTEHDSSSLAKKTLDFYSKNSANNFTLLFNYGIPVPLSSSLVRVNYELVKNLYRLPVAHSIIKNPIKFNESLKISARNNSTKDSEIIIIYNSGE